MTLSTGTRVGPYEILSPLGAGGMGEVYRARDTRLHREVAVKVLPGSFAQDVDRLRRFQHEARAASALNHPAILTIHDFGEHDGAPYVVAELLEGGTLRERLAAGRLPVRKALDYAGQIARGLAAAHEKGIVHRDVKPENVFVTNDGRVKILDFGLAKLAGPEHDGAAGTESPTRTRGTEPGVVMGTVGYMSPEQVKGEPADARSDIFSFGAMLYEMLTGARAFSGGSAAETMSAILRDDPPQPSGTSPGVAASLDRVVRRCLEKSRQERFQSASDLAYALDEAVQSESGSAARTTAAPARPRRAGWVFLAVLAAGLAAWFVVRPVARRESDRLAGSIRSLAVLPLSNLSRDPEQEYFADGMTEALITNLGKIEALRVISRTSAMHYKGTKKSLPEIARELHVDALLEGSVARAGDRVRITAQLVEAATDRPIWSEKYERDLRDVLTLQTEVARGIAQEIKAALTPQEEARLSGAQRVVDPRAYELYLKGRYHWNKRSAGDFKKAIDYFDRAIEKDPTYARAYSGLADSWALLQQYSGLSSRETWPKAKAAALKAVEMDDGLAEAHASLAYVYLNFDWDWARAEREFKRAIALDPRYPTGHHWYGLQFARLGRLEEAIREVDLASQLDPLSLIISQGRALAFYCGRRFDESIEAARKTLEMDNRFAGAHIILGLALEQKRMFPEAIEEFQQVLKLSPLRLEATDALGQVVGNLGHAYALSGRREEAMKLLEELEHWAKEGRDTSHSIAFLYAGLGRKDDAIRWLEKAYQARSSRLTFVKADPRFDTLRSDPRFQDLLRRIGFPS